jgi:hypothetical protein
LKPTNKKINAAQPRLLCHNPNGGVSLVSSLELEWNREKTNAREEGGGRTGMMKSN